jgi:hypothetical protein
MKDQAFTLPLGSRTARQALLLAKLLVLVLLAVSPRALLSPVEPVHKSEDSKRPKSPKNVVRAEPVRIPAEQKQKQGPGLFPPEGVADSLPVGLAWSVHSRAIPVKAFTQLTLPDYLKTGTPESPSHPLAPPA